MAPPFKKAEFDIIFGEGISLLGEIIDLGVDFDIIRKSGSWYSYGETRIGQGRDAVKQILKDNPELKEEIEAKVRAALKEQRD
jgi:recombination protein RecA